jgi:hypothetical protein
MARFSIDDVADDQIVQHCIDNWFVPVAKQMLIDNANMKTIVVAFGQFYNDESDDAVHDAFLALSGEFETWERCFSRRDNKFADKDESYRYIRSYNQKGAAQHKVFGGEKEWHAEPYLDNNEQFIAAMSPYCKPGCFQDMDQYEAYQPMLIVSRNDDGSFKVRDLRNAMDFLK